MGTALVFLYIFRIENHSLCHTSLLCRCMSQHDFGVAHIVTSARRAITAAVAGELPRLAAATAAAPLSTRAA